MTVKDYLLITLMEECNEVAHRCSKALRFGVQDVEIGQELTAEQRIVEEICDLRGVVRELQSRGLLLDLLDTKYVITRTNAKREKLKQFMTHSSEKGIIHPLFVDN